MSELPEVVEELCGFEERYAGTDAERRAANHLAARLKASARQAEVQPIHVRPGWLGISGLLCLAGIGGSILGRSSPEAAFAVVFAAALLMHLDLAGRALTLRRLLFRRVSQNVVSPDPRESEIRVVLVAAYDAPRAIGAAQFTGLGARAGAALRVPVSGVRVPFWALALLLPVLGARAAGVEGQWLDFAQLPQTLALVVAAFALFEGELGVVSPGANDNASGVAAALRTIELLAGHDGAPPVDLVLLGAGSTPGDSIRALLRANRDRWEKEDTLFVGLDACGRGTPAVESASGWTVSYAADPAALEAVGSPGISEAVEPALIRRSTGSPLHALSVRGYRSITLGARGEDGTAPGRGTREDVAERLDPASIEGAAVLAALLIRELEPA